LDNNTVLRSLRYALNYNDARMAELLAMGGYQGDKAGLEALMVRLLKKEDEKDFEACSDKALTAFLNGLILHRRGPLDRKGSGKSPSAGDASGEKGRAAPAAALNNNLILKKLRIAFEFREEDMIRTFARGGFTIAGTELSAMFRRPGHKNYRPCGDQLLRKFLKGLSSRETSPTKERHPPGREKA
jgi:uncharacterized protein YehS (DUF1456 family)